MIGFFRIRLEGAFKPKFKGNCLQGDLQLPLGDFLGTTCNARVYYIIQVFNQWAGYYFQIHTHIHD